ncbi:CG33144 [Drosophila busckii]|uniref:E3 ubiquitin-protein ligase RNF144B n=1 Tax=Drosophila busckii TaxID=30019 RepID=A0A0M4E3Y4_DROBS|nr:uncharacterized protein LOC108596980 [Drosophila busckii]ALC40628.1 CG33144 [Drosophila busckii]
MRPPMPMPMPMPLPMQASALQQNEAFQQAHVHVHATPVAQQPLSAQQQQQLQQQQLSSVGLEIDLEQQQSTHKGKLPPLELLVEHKLSYSSAATYQQQELKDSRQQQQQSHHDLRHSRSTPCSADIRASNFDDAAEHFIINFPAESSQHLQLLPLSETVPLLTHIEATVVDKQRSIRLNKNSASLIFTKKELGHQHQQQQQRRQHHSLYGAKTKTKHLPPTRGQQQRRSLQLNYNNNLVTTAAGTAGQANLAAAKLVPHKQQPQQQVHSYAHSHALGHGHGHVVGVGLTSPTTNGAGAANSARKQLAYSWYAPVYSALEEELEQDSRDSSPIHNLANTKQQTQRASATAAATAAHAADSDTNETVALLETRNKFNIIAAGNAGAERKAHPTRISLSLPPHTQQQQLQQQQQQHQQQQQQHALSASSLGNGVADATTGGDVENSLGLSAAQLPRRRRFENFLMALVGRKSSSSREKEREREREREREPPQRPASPEIRITRTPSEQDVVLRDPAGRQLTNGYGYQSSSSSRLSISGSSNSLNVVQQKLWHMMRREGSASSLHQEKSQSIVQYTGLRKCETVLALTRQGQSQCQQLQPTTPSSDAHGGSGIFSAGGVEQIRPLNRLRHSVNSINGAGTCSRCSSLLSLAATGSRYSLANGFVTRAADSAHSLSAQQQPPSEDLTPEPHINVNAQIRLSNGSNAGKSSAGLPSVSISPSPPSNVTTATLHSSSNNNNNTEELEQQTTPSVDFGTSHAYPLTVSSLLSMASANQAAQACCVRDGITLQHREMTDVTPAATTPSSNFQPFTCKLCLTDVELAAEATTLLQCGCQFCTECMRAYAEFEITEGAYEISCPDAKCPAQGAISLPEIANLTTTNLLKKHHRYRLNREIELDKTRTWCPRAGCETICMVGGSAGGAGGGSAICQMDESPSTSQSYTPQEGAALLSVSVQCPSCKDEFCALCKKAYHPNISCEEFGRRLIADGQDDIGIPFDNELIKCCPMCAVPIEKDEGCAQMMCKRCKHVFCWYCLASLDDDFLLRHYDKGPCKNKLGHSRASVVWHRAQVIGIFAGFGILLLVASPLLLLAAPCIICCKCRGCSGSKIDEVDGELEEEVTALQG